MDERLLAYIRGFNLNSVIAFAENVGRHAGGRPRPGAADLCLLPDDPTRRSAGEGEFDRLNVLQRTGFEQAVALVQGYGCRRLAWLEGNRRSLANATRSRILRAVLEARGLPPPVVARGDFTYDTGFAATLDLFRVGGGAEAIFAANDVGAFGAIDALALRARAPRVPRT